MASLEETKKTAATGWQSRAIRESRPEDVAPIRPKWSEAPIVESNPEGWPSRAIPSNDPTAQGNRPKWMDAPVVTPATGGWQTRAIREGAPAGEPAGRRQHAEDMAYQQHPSKLAQPEGFDARFPAEATAIGGSEYDRARTYGMPGVDVLPPKPAGYDERHPVVEEPTAGEQFTRALRIGSQATGAGAADIAGLPVDLTKLAGNLGLWGTDKLAEMFGGNVDYRLQDSVGGSDSIRSAATSGIEGAFGPNAVIDQSEMTPSERVMYEAERFAAGNMIGSGLIGKLRSAVPRSLAAPYEAAGSDARVLIGDAAAGLGSGAVSGAYHEHVPQSVQDSLGATGDMLAALFGGVGGAGLANMAENVARTGRGSIDAWRALPESIIPRDPLTKLPVSQRDFSNAATLYRNSFRSEEDFASAKKSIADYLENIGPEGTVGPGPHPTTALITADPTQLAIERRARAADSVPYIASDRAVMNDVSQKVGSVRPEKGDPAIPIATAEALARTKSQSAAQALKEAQAALAAKDADLGGVADRARSISPDEASRTLDRVIVDETYLPNRASKNRSYDAAAADPNSVVGTGNAQAAATALQSRMAQRTPALNDDRSGQLASAFAGTPDANGATLPVTRPLAAVMEDRRALSQLESEARTQGNFGRADTARDLRGAVNRDIRASAESGAPGTERLAEADRFYRERFAPYFREGFAAPEFFKGIDRDPQRLSMPREATAARFLTAGPTARAAADDVARILSIAPNRADGIQAATNYLIADAVGKGVIHDGKISETALAAFMARREGALAALPEVRGAFENLLGEVRRGNAERGGLAQALSRAERTAQLTDKEVSTGALSLLIDHEPRKAVEAVFANQNPPARMREIVKEVGANPAAKLGWKAAVADYLRRKVSVASKASVSDGYDATSLAAVRRTFEDNRAALAEVYTPEEMNTLQQAQTRLEILSRRGTQANVGSATAEIQAGGMQALLKAFVEPLGTITTVTHGAIAGGSYSRRMRLIAEQFPDANKAARTIIERVQFDPELAKHLMDFPTSDAQIYTWSAKLNRLLAIGSAEHRD